MAAEQFAAFPEALTVREVKVDGRVLVTTLLDHGDVSKGELNDLYGQRWHAELDLRNIKTTLGLEVLSCQTPQMIEKEVCVHLLAYNLTRLLMAQAAASAAVNPRQLSFKHTVQIWTDWGCARTFDRARLPQHRFVQTDCTNQSRQSPRTARAADEKTQAKSYPWLKTSRVRARWRIAVHGHT
jgi:hypothetical protein